MNVSTSSRCFEVTDVSAEPNEAGHHIVLFSFGVERFRAKCTPANRPALGDLKVFYDDASGELDYAFQGLIAVEQIG